MERLLLRMDNIKDGTYQFNLRTKLRGLFLIFFVIFGAALILYSAVNINFHQYSRFFLAIFYIGCPIIFIVLLLGLYSNIRIVGFSKIEISPNEVTFHNLYFKKIEISRSCIKCVEIKKEEGNEFSKILFFGDEEAINEINRLNSNEQLEKIICELVQGQIEGHP